ncbi:MAG: KH domain-containing protein [Microthrixaceae bacterium]
MSEGEVSDGGAESRATHSTAVLRHMTRSLVDHPDEVEVDVVDRDDRLELNVSVADGDMGRVIGKRGRMANAIRVVTRAAAVRDGVEVDIEFVD